MKILIAVPTYENITPDTFKSIYGLDRGGNHCVFDFIRGYDVATARNRIGSQTIAENADYVLMVDNDIILPSDALVNLLSHGKDVVLGYYARRNSNNEYTGRSCLAKLYDSNGQAYYDYPVESCYTADELNSLSESGEHLIEVHGGGLGCALIKADVFTKTKWPWFKWVIYEDGHGTLSEDLYFCEKIRTAGIPIYSDTRVSCGHLFRHIQNM